MTPVDYKALAERLAEHAALHDSLAAHSDEQRVWADDLRTLVSLLEGMAEAKPLSEYHEDNGPVLWWAFPINEPPYVGQPSDCDWPGYHTHWTPLVVPVVPHPAPQPQPVLSGYGDYGAAIPGIERPCTCHPGDNPPVPCAQKYALSECRAASEPTEAQRLEGAIYGIIDPDYGRVYTITRKLAWEEGYAIGLHGSFTRDLDMIAVPWADTTCDPEHLIRRIVDATGLKLRREPSSKKPHGRLAWSLHFPAFGDPRFVDLSVMPSVNKPTEAQIEAATDAWQAHCGLLLLSREGARDEVLIVLRAALAAKETK